MVTIPNVIETNKQQKKALIPHLQETNGHNSLKMRLKQIAIALNERKTNGYNFNVSETNGHHSKCV